MPMKAMIILGMLLVTAPLYSQDTPDLSKAQDPAAEPYLESVSRQVDAGKALEIRFDYMREDLQTEEKIEGSGTLFLMNEKYKIIMDDMIVYFDGEKQYSQNMEVQEVYVSTPDPDDSEFMFSDPIRLLRNYREEFKYRLIGEGIFRGFPVDEVQLYPRKRNGPYALLKLYTEQVSGDLKAIQVRHKEGILYTMIITGLTEKSGYEASFFRFSPEDYPDTEVIELI